MSIRVVVGGISFRQMERQWVVLLQFFTVLLEVCINLALLQFVQKDLTAFF